MQSECSWRFLTARSFLSSKKGGSVKDEERPFKNRMRNTATKDGKIIQALNEYLGVYNRDDSKYVS